MAEPLSLTSTWFLVPGREAEAVPELRELARQVQEKEPGTLAYLVHMPFADSGAIVSLPPVVRSVVTFFEIYRDPQAFLDHVNGPVFKEFVSKHGSLFLQAHGNPWTTVSFLHREAGFIRGRAIGADTGGGNRHPAVMFEVIAKDQAGAKRFYSDVFGWQYQTGTGGFAYVHFPPSDPPLLGGIGQADPNTPGFEPGHSFYILVDDLDAAIGRAIRAGGKLHMPPASVDGYHFAMIEDPEGNTVGLIRPFSR